MYSCKHIGQGYWRHDVGIFVMVNINYILSFAYIDVIVPCNVLGVWEFGPLGLCSSLGANGPQSTRIIWFQIQNPLATDPSKQMMHLAHSGHRDSGF